MLNETLRSRPFSAGLHALLWLLLVLALLGFGGRAPQFREAETDPSSVKMPVPVARLELLFSPTNWPKIVIDTNVLNLFSTKYFIPTAPAPPPPTTRKVELTYQGFYRTAAGPMHVLLYLSDPIIHDLKVGEMVTTNLYAIAATEEILTLTNSAAQTNLLKINTKQTVEVPLK